MFEKSEGGDEGMHRVNEALLDIIVHIRRWVEHKVLDKSKQDIDLGVQKACQRASLTRCRSDEGNGERMAALIYKKTHVWPCMVCGPAGVRCRRRVLHPALMGGGIVHTMRCIMVGRLRM